MSRRKESASVKLFQVEFTLYTYTRQCCDIVRKKSNVVIFVVIGKFLGKEKSPRGPYLPSFAGIITLAEKEGFEL